ncbi:hypothetical protein C0993_007985 [Termitomyces sp. T159_Od127]|nr:hypothetical protein C0993_007985 [Termitomyces sp. T159_Od127]
MTPLIDPWNYNSDGKPTTARPITKTHSSSIVLDNGLRFLVYLLVMQLPDTTPIVLGLLWLCNVNPDIDCRGLTMKFPSTGACLIAIHLHLQPTDKLSEVRATSAPTAPLDNSDDFPPPKSTLGAPSAFLPNILHNKYKGPNYSAQHSQMTPDTDNMD